MSYIRIIGLTLRYAKNAIRKLPTQDDTVFGFVQQIPFAKLFKIISTYLQNVGVNPTKTFFSVYGQNDQRWCGNSYAIFTAVNRSNYGLNYSCKVS